MNPPKKPVVSESDDSFNLNEDDILGVMGEDDEEEEVEEESEESESEEEEESGEEEEEAEEEEAAAPLKVKADKKGNLIDPKSGKIIAAAGPARRFYEDLANTKHRLIGTLQQNKQFRDAMGQAATTITQLSEKVKTLEGTKGIPEQLGLTPAETAEYLSVAAKFKNDATAVDAIKYMLTRAVQRGINLDALGKGAGANVDLNVFAKDITDRVEQLVKPLSDRFTQSEKDSQEEQVVKQEIGDLLSRDPDSKPHLKVLGAMLRQPEFAHVRSLNEAWLILKDYLRRQGQQRPRPASFNSNERPRPSGRGKPGTMVHDEVDDSPVGVDTEYRDIVRAVIKEHGGVS